MMCYFTEKFTMSGHSKMHSCISLAISLPFLYNRRGRKKTLLILHEEASAGGQRDFFCPIILPKHFSHVEADLYPTVKDHDCWTLWEVFWYCLKQTCFPEKDLAMFPRNDSPMCNIYIGFYCNFIAVLQFCDITVETIICIHIKLNSSSVRF